MKALVLHGPRDLRVEELDDPVPRGDWVRIRVSRVGICGTDKAFYKGTYKPFRLPIIPGHEIVGVIDMVGEEAPKELLGARVTTEINVNCRRCWYCRNCMPTHCPYRETIGISRDGGMAEYVLTRSDLVHHIDGLSDAEAAFVEPLAAIIEMVEMQPPSPHMNIAVLGAGTIGLLAIGYLKLFSPQRLVAVTRLGSPKARYARLMGADDVISMEEVDEYVRGNTPEGQGFDYVVEATGNPVGLDEAIRITRPRGIVAAKSTHGAPVSFNYTMAVVKELRIIGSRCGPFEKAIDVLRRKLIPVEKLVTSTYRLEDGPLAFEKSFERGEVKIHLVLD